MKGAMAPKTVYGEDISRISAPVLAFDTSLNGCVVAVYDPVGDEILSSATFETEREQAAKLVPLIQKALEEAKVAFADVGLIVTGHGPGSFTGLRIGLSAARSFGMALNIPVHGVGSLSLMAACCAHEGDAADCLVLLETKRQDFYVQRFARDLSALSDPVCASAEEISQFGHIEDMIWCGDAVERFTAETGLQSKHGMRSRNLFDPAILARFGTVDFVRHGQASAKVEPLYLRGADVSVSNKKNREILSSPL